jgi:hypothetical protein
VAVAGAIAVSLAGACSHGYEPLSEEEARELERAAPPSPASAGRGAPGSPGAPGPAGVSVAGETASRGGGPSQAPTRSATGAAPADVPASATAGGIRWEAGPPLVARPPSSSMRAAEYAVAGEGGAGAAELTVFHFAGMGGGVDENLQRWLGQFRKPDGASGPVDSRRERAELAGMVVHRIEARGTFTGGGPGMGGGAPVPDALLLGAIVEGPSGPVFFKLVGPAPTVERARQAFDHLLASLATVR